jgi:hypothetical protein
MVECVFRQAGEAGRVGFGSFGEPENGVVAGYFTLEAETLFYPDEGWVKGKENKSQFLDQVNPIVCPAEVPHFVKNDLFELGWSEFFEEPLRDENARREEADYAGAIYFG